MKYKVGQILFMISVKSQKIFPLQVVEEVCRTNLKGTIKTYMVQLPDENKTKIDINDIKGELFTDIEVLRSKLLLNATASIDKMIYNVHTLSSSYFKNKEKEGNIKEIKESNDKMQVVGNDDIITIDIGNGVKAKMKKEELEKVGNKWKYYF